MVVVVAADAGALADAGKLLAGTKDWLAASFVVANAVRGTIDPIILKRVVGEATLTNLRGFELEDATRDVLTAGQLRGIPKLDRARLAKETSPAQAGRMLRDLTAFRLTRELAQALDVGKAIREAWIDQAPNGFVPPIGVRFGLK
jgi:hypothetical protein